MQLNEYIQSAITTESHIPVLKTDVEYFTNVMTAVISAGNLLDVIKKDTFYGTPTDPNKLSARQVKLSTHTTALQTTTPLIATSYPQAAAEVNHIDTRIAHGIIGMVTEAVELLEALRASLISGEPIDRINLLEELGDVNWYHAILVDALQGDWQLILEANLRKLEARNKGKAFNAAAVINRDVEAERALLEQNLA